MAGLPVRRAPYKDFLQPALQRRFASTATILLTVSYVEAVLLSNWDSLLWSWFPIGPAGFRTAIIFTCGLAILVLRIAHYHVGLRTTGSGLQTLSANLATLSNYETVFWYCFSSFLFCPVFIWSSPKSANLQWVTYLSGDRAKANERPIFLACYLGCCALKQSMEHFVRDVDHLDLGTMGKRDAKDPSEASSVSLKKVLLRLPAIFAQSVHEAAFALVVAFGLYFFIFRSFAYGWTLMFLRPFYNLPRTNMLPNSWPFDLFLAARCLFAGAFLFFVWQAGNAAFSIFMVKEPLKNGQPLTSESKDPNGSLLNGLKSKKQSIQCFAMWELAHIAQGFPDRRKALFADIDRKDGPIWAQIYAICMDVVKSVETRADNYGKPVAPPPAPPADAPRPRVTAPLKEDNILTPEKGHSAGSKAREVVKIMTSGSKSAPSPLSELSPLAKKTWDQTKDHVLTKEQQAAMSPENIQSQVEKVTLGFMNLRWVRALVQHPFRNELAGAVLGTPYAEPSLYINATNALCQLAIHSLGEDQYGNVHRDVPSIIRTLTAAIRKVEALKQRFPVHWTDIDSGRESPEVDQVLDAMRDGLGQVVASFEPFCHDLRLTPGDLRLAKEAATKPEVEAKAEKTAKADGETKKTEGGGNTRNEREARAEAKVQQRRQEMEQVRRRQPSEW